MASSVTPGELHADTSQAAPGNSTVAAAATASAAATATAAANAVMDATAGAASAGVSAAAGAAGAASDSSGDSWVPTIVTGLLLFSSFLGYLYFYQESLLYYPKQPIHLTKSNPPEYRSPEFYSIDYRELWATTTDGIKVHTWLLLTKQPRKAPTLIFFHGNAGNMGFRLPNMKRLHDTCQVNILMVDYRGYGHSEGEPSEEGLMLDAEAALDELLKQEDIDPNNIMAFGRSLGGAVATSLAHRRPGALRGLVLENTFTNISAMASKMFPFLDPIQSLVLRMDWPTAARIADLTLPIMLVSAKQDTLVPPAHMISLHRLATKSTDLRLHQLDGGHNDLWIRGGTKYWSLFFDFIDRHRVKGGRPAVSSTVGDAGAALGSASDTARRRGKHRGDAAAGARAAADTTEL